MREIFRLGLAFGMAALVAAVVPAPADASTGFDGSAAWPHAKKAAKKKPAPKAAPAAPADAPADASAPAADAAAAPATPAAASSGDSGLVEMRGGTARIDFSEAMIEGTGVKAGAVYLYERRETDLLSIVKLRTTYRDEMIRTVFSPADTPVEMKKATDKDKGKDKSPSSPLPGADTPGSGDPKLPGVKPPVKGKTGK